jgi:hypothetical protein
MKKNFNRGVARIELATSRTQSEDHTTRPNALFYLLFPIYYSLSITDKRASTAHTSLYMTTKAGKEEAARSAIHIQSPTLCFARSSSIMHRRRNTRHQRSRQSIYSLPILIIDIINFLCKPLFNFLNNYHLFYYDLIYY